MIGKLTKTILIFAFLSNRNAFSYNIILNFKGSPKDAFKGTGLKWSPINPSGIACFYAGETAYTDQDGQVIFSVPMPSLNNFDLVLGKDLTPKPIIDKTINHISIAKDSIKRAVIYHFKSQEVEVDNHSDLGQSSVIDKKEHAKEGKEKETETEAAPTKIKKNLWSIKKGEIPEDGRLKNNTIIVLIDCTDVVVPTSKFYTPSENPNVFLPTFFLVERDDDVDKNVLQSFNKPSNETAPMAAIHTLETFEEKTQPQPQNKELEVKIKQVDEAVQE